MPTYYAQYKTTPSLSCIGNTGTSITIRCASSFTAGIRLYRNNSVTHTNNSTTQADFITYSLTNGTEYTFNATFFDVNGSIKEGPKSANFVVKAWSTTTTYNVTFPVLQKGYGVAQQTWTYYDNYGVKRTQVTTLSDSGYSGETASRTTAVRSGLTVAITDTKYYSDIADYIEPSTTSTETSWTITTATTVKQLYTQ